MLQRTSFQPGNVVSTLRASAFELRVSFGIRISGFGFSSWRFVLRREIPGMAGDAVFIRAAKNLRRLGEIGVRRRRGRLPFQRGGVPRIVAVHLFAVLDAPK